MGGTNYYNAATTDVCRTVKKEQKEVSIKRFLKGIKSSQCSDASMNVQYTNKKCHAHSDMYTITWSHYSTTIPTGVAVAHQLALNLLLLM